MRYKINRLVILSMETKKELATPRRNREVTDLEAYRKMEKARYDEDFDMETEVLVTFTEIDG